MATITATAMTAINAALTRASSLMCSLCLSPLGSVQTVPYTLGGIRRIGTIHAAVTEAAPSILSVDRIDGGVRVTGQVDLSSVERFRDALTAAAENADEMIVDLGGCTYLGSEGIGVLIETVQALGEGRLILRSPNGLTQKVLDLSGLGNLPNVEISP
jgi:anti-anti-sigma factor